MAKPLVLPDRAYWQRAIVTIAKQPEQKGFGVDVEAPHNDEGDRMAAFADPPKSGTAQLMEDVRPTEKTKKKKPSKKVALTKRKIMGRKGKKEFDDPGISSMKQPRIYKEMHVRRGVITKDALGKIN